MSGEIKSPGEWFPGAVEVEQSGVFIALGPDAAATIVWHWCAGRRGWDGACIRNHVIVNREPLTITASLACDDCPWHGFITDGKWISLVSVLDGEERTG